MSVRTEIGTVAVGSLSRYYAMTSEKCNDVTEELACSRVALCPVDSDICVLRLKGNESRKAKQMGILVLDRIFQGSTHQWTS